MKTPFVIEAQQGTTFVVNASGCTEVTRQDQPECTIPTADLVEFVKKITTQSEVASPAEVG